LLLSSAPCPFAQKGNGTESDALAKALAKGGATGAGSILDRENRAQISGFSAESAKIADWLADGTHFELSVDFVWWIETRSG
jgi:hypothetical protein